MPTLTSPIAPAGINSSPDALPAVIPVATRAQLLPFEALSWENFERLCHRLTALEGEIEYCARYGLQGEAQEGIDVFARRFDGRYHCLQAKRHKSFGATKLRAAVDLFIAGRWAVGTATFTIAVQAALGSTAIQREIEKQAKRLGALGIDFRALDGEQLTGALRAYPQLIDDFFGRSWVEALLGADVAAALGTRLDGEAFARVRGQLENIYDANFHFIDPGSFGSIGDETRPALTLLERYLKPDMVVHEVASASDRIDFSPTGTPDDHNNAAPLGAPGLGDTTLPAAGLERSRARRLSLADWLGDSERLAVVGDAGSGKSTLLRVVALDLLGAQDKFPELGARWGRHIPIYVPFARWAGEIARDGNRVGLKEIVRRTLEPQLTRSIVDMLDQAIDDRRIVLLVDGLDEWSDEQAARTTLANLVTAVQAHDIPIIVSGRPRGLGKIGSLPTTWKRGTIAVLSREQQENIAARWFGRYAQDPAVGPRPGVDQGAEMQTGRFMAQLARDRSLATLSEIPLLLTGLINLSLRGQILPRTKSEIYDQLVRLMLEVHPSNRATAAGDSQSRFRYAQDPEQRRGAIARLAFVVRENAGDAGFPLRSAREELRRYLTSPEGYDLDASAGRAAATEILAVNAETQGLIIEKASQEIGFVHASFEEYLSAEHVSGWPFQDIERFVQERAGHPRWRNVIANLLRGMNRRDEFDRLVALIEQPEPDPLAAFHKHSILGEIAIGAGARSPATARRLVQETLRRVETNDWMPARRDALRSILSGVADPFFQDQLEERLQGWAPARLSSRSDLIVQCAQWESGAALEEMVWRALHDEDRGVQRTAAAVYPKVFGNSDDARPRLITALATTRSLNTASTILEALALGWAADPAVLSLFEEAMQSPSLELRLVAVLGLCKAGRRPDDMRDVVLQAQNHWSDLSWPHHSLASALLGAYWANDEVLIESALRSAGRDYGTQWEHDAAISYLLECDVGRPEIRAFVLRELADDFPFHAFDDGRHWIRLGMFARSDEEIRAAARAYWGKSKSRVIGMHKLVHYVGQTPDDGIADILIDVLNGKTDMDQYWALRALLTGWERDHVSVRAAFDAVLTWPDERLIFLVAFLPELMQDDRAARQRLLTLARRSDVRRDMLGEALEKCGCDHNDEEAVAAILRPAKDVRGQFPASYPLYRSFSRHPQVRGLAIRQCGEPVAPLGAIAAGYGDDPEIRAILLRAAVPLPAELRSQLIEVAATAGSGTCLETILSNGMAESDADLRVRMVSAHHQRWHEPQQVAADRAALLEAALIVSSDLEMRRGAALAGLVHTGGLTQLAGLIEGGKPLRLEIGGFLRKMPTLERLICERLADFEDAFGESLPERLDAKVSGLSLPTILTRAPNSSPEARKALIAFAENDKLPRTPGALRALAAVRPRSELLLQRCWDVLDRSQHDNRWALYNGEVALLLRDQFPDAANVREGIIERFERAPHEHAIVLAIYAPGTGLIPVPRISEHLGREFGDWATAIHASASQAPIDQFCQIMDAMLTRRWRSEFDCQHIVNVAILERFRKDPEAERCVLDRLNASVHPSISGSAARYLAAAGKLAGPVQDPIKSLLQTLASSQSIPVAGLDAQAGEWRTLRVTLLDALQAGMDDI
ncbi:hypothetical protein LH128_25573 [Sphingomonas sp. LH128]|uniref:NACHT domain-containing protein n=1 Tax=Sphingomonas sp. LH128 TaxID=473781 RepID=UPI00027C9CC7|nr:NACHT domain-containing protein [Sphingomonas sp. LH128]EJU10119.1 hypothetical protein LH128_25573 [Sphingomonas sp. LH128]